MLYIVATPIGNLKEITNRAVEVLQDVDYIACEDTRTSRVLLDHYGINKKLVSYHKFNENKASEDIIKDLKNGLNIAIISDAGMPGISDPGAVIINDAIKEEIEYTVVSGPSAFTNAFVLSGYPTPFTFIGFLPDINKKRYELLDSYSKVNSTLIFYCSPHDLHKDIADMYKVLGDREVCVVREISKKFEEVTFSTLARGFESTLKGEFVVLVKYTDEKMEIDEDKNMKTLLEMGLTKTEASKVIAKLTGKSKSEVYKNAIRN